MKHMWIAVILIFVSCARGPQKPEGSQLSEMGDKEAEQAVVKSDTVVEKADSAATDEKSEEGAAAPGASIGDPSKITASPEYRSLGVALQSGDESLLAREASKFLAKNAKDLVTLNAMAMHYFNRKKPDLAKLILAKALRLYPNSATVHNNLGLVYLREAKNLEAVNEFRKAQELDVSHPESAANLGSLLAKSKNYAAAVGYLQKAFRVLDKDPVVANNFAVALIGIKKYKEAEEVMVSAKLDESNNPSVLLNCAIFLIEHMKSKKPGLKIVNKIRFLSQDEFILSKAQRLAEKAEALK